MNVSFVAHDPGAVQLIRPLYERCLADPEVSANLINLRNPDAPSPADSIGPDASLVFVGSSTNSIELEVIKEAKKRGIRSIMIIELKYIRARNPDISIEKVADRYILTCESSVAPCRAHLAEVGAENVLVEALGSPHLESFALEVPRRCREETLEAYGLRRETKIVVLVGFPEDPMLNYFTNNMLEALQLTIDALELCDPGANPLACVVRPHPRSSEQLIRGMQVMCDAVNAAFKTSGKTVCIFMDDNFKDPNRVDNRSILGAASLSITSVSTMAIESLAVGCPTANLVSCLPGGKALASTVSNSFGTSIPNIESKEELRDVIQACLQDGHGAGFNVTKQGDEDEECRLSRGATDRCWDVIVSELRHSTPDQPSTAEYRSRHQTTDGRGGKGST